MGKNYGCDKKVKAEMVWSCGEQRRWGTYNERIKRRYGVHAKRKNWERGKNDAMDNNNQRKTVNGLNFWVWQKTKDINKNKNNKNMGEIDFKTNYALLSTLISLKAVSNYVHVKVKYLTRWL